MMILSAVYSSAPTFTVFGPVNTASPATSLTLLALHSARTPEVRRSTVAARKPWTFSQSTRTSAPMMPMSALRTAAS